MARNERNRPARQAESTESEDRRKEELALKDRALEAAAEGIVIADARKPNMPLIYVNSGFERLTGYPAESALGRNCRFLQGPGTDPAAAAEIRRAIAERRACLVEILNYRRDGTPFWNRLSITPVYDAAGQLTHFIGVQSDITARRNAEEALRRATIELEAVNRRMKMELDRAARIQQALLPLNDQEFEGVRFCWRFRPCVELAGDSLNIIPLGGDRIAFYVTDVSGHGVAAALLSFTLNRWLSLLLGLDRAAPAASADGATIVSPAAVADRLNRQFPMTEENPQYFTMVYGVLEQRSGDFRYVSAGHPGPVLVSASGDAACLESRGFPIGLLPEAGFQDESVRLRPGDRLYLYTDGLAEAANAQGEEFGIERFRARLLEGRELSLSQSLDSVLGLLDEWRGKEPLRDDVTLLALEYRGAP
jgi:sigma-B regulation protein RsbU (phosphoserine phosphatase)